MKASGNYLYAILSAVQPFERFYAYALAQPARIIGGVNIHTFIYSYRVLHHYFLLKSIVFKVCENKYMNIGPSNYRRWLRHCAYGALEFF